MKNKLLYLTIGVLIGIVVMQWTMPSGVASEVTSIAGIVDIHAGQVLDANGQVWQLRHPDHGC